MLFSQHLPHLFKVALHGFVRQQQDGPHQVSHQDEISFGLQVQSHDIVVVVTLGPQLLLGGPLVQTDLKQTGEVSDGGKVEDQRLAPAVFDELTF